MNKLVTIIKSALSSGSNTPRSRANSMEDILNREELEERARILEESLIAAGILNRSYDRNKKITVKITSVVPNSLV